MNTLNNKQMVNILHTYISTGLQQEVEKEFENLKKKLVEDLDKKKDTICAGILLNVMKMVEINEMKDKIVFTIRKIEDK